MFPSDLAAELEELNRHFTREFDSARPDEINAARIIHNYRETAYDSLAPWYDHWYKGHWCHEEPFSTLIALIRSYHESKRGNLSELTILDSACGTGNTYAAFTRHGYHVFGTDGSKEMLSQAYKNCTASGTSTERLIDTPINWTDGDSYEKLFGNERFDVIINTANSLCHIPPVPEYLDVALANFHRLLKPGGLLIVDTKRYVRGEQEGGIETYRELRWAADLQEWIVRSERGPEENEVPELGLVRFHTKLLYDNDPSFGRIVRRALIVLTIYGQMVTPRVLVIPYYPLPAHELKDHMTKTGFAGVVLPAMKDLLSNWRYDIVIGKKATTP
jgi:SAM-dependent methyltransferase